MRDCSQHSEGISAAPAPSMMIGRRIPALDGLRGIAILCVVVYHFADQFQTCAQASLDRAFLRVCQTGWIGVELFFVLSGFLITGILLDTQDSKFYFSPFYGRRLLRISPAYYATLTGLFVLMPCFYARLPAGVRDMVQSMADYQVWFWSYMANWLYAYKGAFGSVPGGYFWSLAVEEQFYLVWPLVVFCVNRTRLVRAVLIVIAANILLRLCLLGCGTPPTSTYSATLTHLDGLLSGALVAVYFRHSLHRQRPDKRFRACAVLCGLALVSYGLWTRQFCFWDAKIAGIGMFLLAVVFSYLLAATIAAKKGSLFERRLSSPILQSFGTAIPSTCCTSPSVWHLRNCFVFLNWTRRVSPLFSRYFSL